MHKISTNQAKIHTDHLNRLKMLRNKKVRMVKQDDKEATNVPFSEATCPGNFIA